MTRPSSSPDRSPEPMKEYKCSGCRESGYEPHAYPASPPPPEPMKDVRIQQTTYGGMPMGSFEVPPEQPEPPLGPPEWAHEDFIRDTPEPEGITREEARALVLGVPNTPHPDYDLWIRGRNKLRAMAGMPNPEPYRVQPHIPGFRGSDV